MFRIHEGLYRELYTRQEHSYHHHHHSYHHHQGVFQRDYYAFGSVHDSNHNGVNRNKFHKSIKTYNSPSIGYSFMAAATYMKVRIRSNIGYTKASLFDGQWRPVARGGSRGFRQTPLVALAKFIFNETAAVQGTIIQPCSGIVTDGIQAVMQVLQGVVTYTSPVEVSATGIKNSGRWKSSLITWSLRSEALDHLIMQWKHCNCEVIIDHPLMNN